jgi:hypothetical protein
MGLFLSFRCYPSPQRLDVPDDGLATSGDVDMLDNDFLLGALAAVAIATLCKNDRTGNVTLAQLRDIVLKYLRDHPENCHCGAIDITYVALRNFFPCGGKPMPPVPASIC